MWTEKRESERESGVAVTISPKSYVLKVTSQRELEHMNGVLHTFSSGNQRCQIFLGA
jgi:hypothetical protein